MCRRRYRAEAGTLDHQRRVCRFGRIRERIQVQPAEEGADDAVGLHGLVATEDHLGHAGRIAAQRSHVAETSVGVGDGQLLRSGRAVHAEAAPLRGVQFQLQRIAGNLRLQHRRDIALAAFGADEQQGGGQQRHRDAAAAEHQQELASLAIHQHQRHHRHHRVEYLDRHVGAVGDRTGQTGLVEDVDRVGQHGVDAGGLGEGEHRAGQQERPHIATAEQAVARLRAAGVFRRLHPCQCHLDLAGGNGPAQRVACALDPSTPYQPARRFAQQQHAGGEHQARQQAAPENRPPRVILRGEQHALLFGGGQSAYRGFRRIHRVRVVQADDRRQHQSDGQQQLEHRRAAPAPFRREHFGQVQRHHHADQAAAHALQQPAEQQWCIAGGQRHDRNAEGEQQAGQEHRAAPADQIRDGAGEQRRKHAAQQHRRHHEAELLAGEMPADRGRGLQVRQRAGDDADVDAIEQAAHAGDEQQVAHLPARRGVMCGCGQGGGGIVHSDAGPVDSCAQGAGNTGTGVPVRRTKADQPSGIASPSTNTCRT